MRKSDIKIMPKYFDRYINLVEDDKIISALEKSNADLSKLDLQIFNKLGDKTYAEDKWTVKKIFQHMIDTERIISYRALRFARNDKTELPGFDEKSFAENDNAKDRTFEDLLEELKTVRRSTVLMYKSFNDENLQRKGISFEVELSVLEIGFTIIGHQIHHLKIIEERYTPLVDKFQGTLGSFQK